LFIEAEGKSIVIFNIADQFFAIADVCTHDDGPLGDGDLEGYNIVCPRMAASLMCARGKLCSCRWLLTSRPIRSKWSMG